MASITTHTELTRCLSSIEALEQNGFKNIEQVKKVKSRLLALSQTLEREAGPAIGAQQGSEALSTRAVALQLAGRLSRIVDLVQDAVGGGTSKGEEDALVAISTRVFDQLNHLYREAPRNLEGPSKLNRFWDDTSAKEFSEIKNLKLSDPSVRTALQKARAADPEGPIPVILCQGSKAGYIKVCFIDQEGKYRKEPLQFADIKNKGLDEIAGSIRKIVTGVINPPRGVIGLSVVDQEPPPPLVAALHAYLPERLSCFDVRDLTDLATSGTIDRETLRAREQAFKQQLQEAQSSHPEAQPVVIAPAHRPHSINLFVLGDAGEIQKFPLAQLDQLQSFTQAVSRIRTKASVGPEHPLYLMAHPEQPVLPSIRMLQDIADSELHQIPASLTKDHYPLNGTPFHQQCAALCFQREFNGLRHSVDLENHLLESYPPTSELVRVQAWLLPNQTLRLVWSSLHEDSPTRKQILELPVGMVHQNLGDLENRLGNAIRKVIDPEETGIVISLFAEQASQSIVHEGLQSALEEAWYHNQSFTAEHPAGPRQGHYSCHLQENRTSKSGGATLVIKLLAPDHDCNGWVGHYSDADCTFDVETGCWRVLVPSSLDYAAFFGHGELLIGPPVEHEVRTHADLERVFLALYDPDGLGTIKRELEENKRRLLEAMPEVDSDDLARNRLEGAYRRCLGLKEGQQPKQGEYVLTRNPDSELCIILYNDSGEIKSSQLDDRQLESFVSEEVLHQRARLNIAYKNLVAPRFTPPIEILSEKLGTYHIESTPSDGMPLVRYAGVNGIPCEKPIQLELDQFSDDEIADRGALLEAIESRLTEILPTARLQATVDSLRRYGKAGSQLPVQEGAYQMTRIRGETPTLVFTIRGPGGKALESRISLDQIPPEACKDPATFKQWAHESIVAPMLDKERDLERYRLRHRLRQTRVTAQAAGNILRSQPPGTFAVGWEPTGVCVLSCVDGEGAVQTALFPLDEEWLAAPAEFDDRIRKRITEGFPGVTPKPLEGREALEELLVACKKVGCPTRVSARKALLNQQPGTYLIHSDEVSGLPMVTWQGEGHIFHHEAIPQRLLLADGAALAAWLTQKIGPQAFRLMETAGGAEGASEAGKTEVSRQLLARGVFPDVPPMGPFPYQGQRYHLVSRNSVSMSRIPYVSLGSNPVGREALLLDPANSPGLEEKFNGWLERLNTRHSNLEPGALLATKEVLDDLTQYVQEAVFSRISTDAVDEFVDAWRQNERGGKLTQAGETHPVVPIDAFVAEGVGVCRHISMVTAYFLDRLVREHGGTLVQKGTVHHVRSNIPSGGHAWNLFVTADGDAWHIDNTWRSLPPTQVAAGGEVDKSELEMLASRGYGTNAMKLEETLIG